VSAMHAAIGKNSRHEANRLLALAGVIFAKAKDWGDLPESAANPAHGIKQFAEASRDRWLRPEEVKRLLESLRDEDNAFYRSAFLLYLLLGVRRSELLRLRWDDIDLRRRTLTLRETKANRVHHLPLADAAASIFAELREHRVQDNPYVFPSPTVEGGHMHDLKRPWQQLRKRAKLADCRLHDLRRTVGSWLAQDGASLHLIGAVLNHSESKTTQVYARLGDDVTRVALDRHAERVVALLAAPADDQNESKRAQRVKQPRDTEHSRKTLGTVNGHRMSAKRARQTATKGAKKKQKNA
jgi:integrase